jgi:integrase
MARPSSVRSRATVVQQKTDRPVQFEITEQTQDSVGTRIQLRGGRGNEYLFPSRVHPERPISTRQYGRLVDRRVAEIGLDPASYGTHSMR